MGGLCRRDLRRWRREWVLALVLVRRDIRVSLGVSMIEALSSLGASREGFEEWSSLDAICAGMFMALFGFNEIGGPW